MNRTENIYQFIDLPRVDPPKKGLKVRTTTFNEIYRIFTEIQVEAQSDRCLACGNPYCQHKCPISNNIPNWLKLAHEGRIIEAAELAHSTNSLPEVCGRVCPQDRLCEGSCTLNAEFGAVTIGSIEKYIVETAFAMGWRPSVIKKSTTAKEVAVIGSGPAGLTCADYLNRNGVKVIVYEREAEIGGLLTFGIPAFKLEKSVLAKRREIFSDLGIEFQLGVDVGRDIALETISQQYDAVFLAVGTYQSIQANIPNEDANGVLSALPFLINNTKRLLGFATDNYQSMRGKKVVVLGGGDTAMDCVRTSIRQQAKEVLCVYRRDQQNMPGSKKEYQNAVEEGVKFQFNAQPIGIEVDADNQVKGIRIIKTQMSIADANGRRQVEVIANSEEIIACDAIIIAFGFSPHAMPWLEKLNVNIDHKGRIKLEGEYLQQTTNPKIFAGGDVTRGSDLVVTAILEGRKAAEGIQDYLNI